MMNNCTKFRFDVFTNTLTISKAFEKKASIPGSAEQKMMSRYLKFYGENLTINRYAAHKSAKGLTFAKMENYIHHTREAEKMLARFENVKRLSKSQDKPYLYVKEWFLGEYPHYSENPEFDADGFVVVKATSNFMEKSGNETEIIGTKAAEEVAEEPNDVLPSQVPFAS